MKDGMRSQWKLERLEWQLEGPRRRLKSKGEISQQFCSSYLGKGAGTGEEAREIEGRTAVIAV